MKAVILVFFFIGGRAFADSTILTAIGNPNSVFSSCRDLEVPDNGSIDEREFLTDIIQYVRDGARISRAHAYRDWACLNGDKSWFVYGERRAGLIGPISPENFRQGCAANIDSLKRQITAQYPGVR